MALETGDYINDLVITNPTSTDPKSAGDDHLRLEKKVLKQCINGFSAGVLMWATDTGSATAHVLSPTTALLSYGAGQILIYRPANTNSSGAVTVNVSALGAKSIKTKEGADPTANDITASQPIVLVYDGTNFVMVAGSGLLSKTGSQTMTGNFTLTGNQTVSGTLNVTGDIGGTGGNKKADKAGSTYTGTHDYSGATSVLVPTATLNGQAVNYAQLVAASFVTVLPAQPGGTITYKLTSLAGTAGWSVDAPAVGASLYMFNNFGCF